MVSVAILDRVLADQLQNSFHELEMRQQYSLSSFHLNIIHLEDFDDTSELFCCERETEARERKEVTKAWDEIIFRSGCVGTLPTKLEAAYELHTW